MPSQLQRRREAQTDSLNRYCREAFTRSRTRKRNRRQMLIDLFADQVSADGADPPPCVRQVSRALRQCGKMTRQRKAFRLLTLHVEAHAGRMLDAARPAGENDYVTALFRLARHYDGWLRPLEAWRPSSRNPSRQFGQLARHLLARYPVPALLDSLFFTHAAPRAEEWFRHVGTGNNLCTAPGMSLPLTRKMAHYALTAPDHFSIVAALRWGEVLGLGGSRQLAKAINASNLGWQVWDAADEAWWLTILHWFVNHPQLELEHVAPIIDYVHHRRFEADGQPGNFDLAGRSPAALLRLMYEWHHDLYYGWRREYAEFSASGLRPGKWVQEKDGLLVTWWTEEIRNSRALLQEGRAMRHCVATYQGLIETGRSSIWSLRVERFGGAERAVTIEVRTAQRAIVQVRGKYNRRPTEDERRILERWARENGLRMVS